MSRRPASARGLERVAAALEHLVVVAVAAIPKQPTEDERERARLIAAAEARRQPYAIAAGELGLEHLGMLVEVTRPGTDPAVRAAYAVGGILAGYIPGELAPTGSDAGATRRLVLQRAADLSTVTVSLSTRVLICHPRP